MFQPPANPLLTGVPTEGFDHLIVSARLRMFQPENGRPFQQFEAHFKNKSTVSKAAFFLSEGPESDTSSAGSCNKFRKFLQQVPIHALTIPVEVVPARTPAHALKELVLFENISSIKKDKDVFSKRKGPF